jgi:hypothetical protein
MLTADEKTAIRCPTDHTHQWTIALRSAASQPTNGEVSTSIPGYNSPLILSDAYRETAI